MNPKQQSVPKPPRYNRLGPPAPAANDRFGGGENFAMTSHKKVRTPWLMFLLIAVASVTLFVLSNRYDSLIGQIAAPILGLCSWHGLVRGAMHKILILPVTLGMVWLATARQDLADSAVVAMTGQQSAVGSTIVTIIAFTVVMFLASWGLKAFRRKVIMPRRFILGLDRLLGTGVGAAEGGLMVLVMLWSAVLLKPQAQNVVQHPDVKACSGQYMLADGILRISNEVNGTRLDRIVNEHNLLAKIPAVQEALARAEQGNGAGSVNPILFQHLFDALRGSPDAAKKLEGALRECQRGG